MRLFFDLQSSHLFRAVGHERTPAVRLRQSWDLYTKYGHVVMFGTRDLIVQITCM